MPSNWFTNPSDVLTILGSLATAIGSMYALLRRIRHNDLKHLDIKLDLMHESTLRIEDKLDRHLEAHAEGKV